MYKRKSQGWSRHFDFIVLDEICLQLAFMLAVYLREGYFAYSVEKYRDFAFVLFIVDAAVLVLNDSMRNVVNRGRYVEFIETLKHCILNIAIASVYLFVSKQGATYSRIVVVLTALFHIIFGLTIRLIWKKHLKNFHKDTDQLNTMLVITTPESAEEILERLSKDNLFSYNIIGVVLTEPTRKRKIGGFPIVSNLDDVSDYICRAWIDSVYIDVSLSDERIVALMDDCAQMAVPTHFHVPNMSRNGSKRFSEKLGGTTVLTTSINYITPYQAFVKRCFDIFAGLIGSLGALLIMAIIGPIIKKVSPGPILFKQERVGLNGKRFNMYKLRSMYMDADDKKKELMEKNRVKDGMMFKLDFDPRIIGNRIDEDGNQKTGIGEFIRRTSLDEFPQFFNVLNGTMSLIGTRPPTPDEWMKYEYHHRARLAIKPGITGMWQVSGRSNITDFEDVVRLDTEYISDWSFALDIKIFLKTIVVLIRGDGAM